MHTANETLSFWETRVNIVRVAMYMNYEVSIQRLLISNYLVNYGMSGQMMRHLMPFGD